MPGATPSARACALAREAGFASWARLKRQCELEREGGTLLYSWDIKVAGKPGITEVHVSARTGRILSVGHEAN